MAARWLVCMFCIFGVAACSGNTPTSPNSTAEQTADVPPAASETTTPAASTGALSNINLVNGLVVLKSATSGTANLKGTHRFSFNALLGNGRPPVFEQPLFPGSSISLSGEWAGADLPATLKLQGKTYTGYGTPFGPSAILSTSGSFTVPAPTQARTANVTAPFTLTGRLTQPSMSFTGGGTATISLQWNAAGEQWAVTGVRFDVQPTH